MRGRLLKTTTTMSEIKLKVSKRRVAYMKKDMVLTNAEIYSTIKADHLLERAKDNSGIDEGEFYRAVKALQKEIRNFLVTGHGVQVPGLGIFKFSVAAHAGEVGDEDAGGASAVYRRKILFRPAKELKNELEKVEFVTDNEIEEEEPEP